MITGIDIDPSCAVYVDFPNQVHIGSQDDPVFPRNVVTKMSGIDIVLDDGSHIGRHQIATFETLFPLLPDGGLYLIEDLHTSYWFGLWEGGFRRRGTAIEYVRNLIDDMRGWYHDRSLGTLAKNQVRSIHMYDSIAVIEKRTRSRPRRISVGGQAL